MVVGWLEKAIPPSPWLDALSIDRTARLAIVTLLLLVTISLLLRLTRPYDLPSHEYTVTPPTLPSPARPDVLPEAPVPPNHQTDSSAVRCYAPATGQFLGVVDAASPAAVDSAVASAGRAQRAWARTSFAQRRAVLRSLLAHVLDHAEEVGRVAALDSGKTAVDAQLGEVLVTAERIRWTLKHGEDALKPERRPNGGLLMVHKRNTVRYEPLGVVAALVSWNYPFHNLVGPVVSALFAGNAIVVKVSEQTAWSCSYFTAIVRGALAAHGYDTSLVQTLVCWPSVASHLVSHPAIHHITFIGSQRVGRQVAASAARSLTPVLAELGGKDPCLVLDSASRDLPRIVEVILRGTFQAAGQNCIGIERVVAAGELYDRLVALLEPRVRSLRLGPDADVGAMISDASFDHLEQLIAEAVAQGARLLVGGRRHHHPEHPRGYYFEPTLIVDVAPPMRIALEECFAPILTLQRAASSTPPHMLALANIPCFGLGASVFGSEGDASLAPIIAGLQAGMVAVNDFASFYAVQLPFGGVGGSGYGRFAGLEGLRGLCNIKSVCEDRLGWLGIRTSIPGPVRYPVSSQLRGWNFTQGVIEFGYGEVRRKMRGLTRILQNLQ